LAVSQLPEVEALLTLGNNAVARAHETIVETHRLISQKRGLLSEAHQLQREALSEFIRYRTALILAHLPMMPSPIQRVVTAVK
jgi:hypothetical protein